MYILVIVSTSRKQRLWLFGEHSSYKTRSWAIDKNIFMEFERMTYSESTQVQTDMPGSFWQPSSLVFLQNPYPYLGEKLIKQMQYEN